MAKNTDLLEYEGANFLRQRVVLSILSGRAVRIKNIRTSHDEPGLRGKRHRLVHHGNLCFVQNTKLA